MTLKEFCLRFRNDSYISSMSIKELRNQQESMLNSLSAVVNRRTEKLNAKHEVVTSPDQICGLTMGGSQPQSFYQKQALVSQVRKEWKNRKGYGSIFERHRSDLKKRRQTNWKEPVHLLEELINPGEISERALGSNSSVVTTVGGVSNIAREADFFNKYGYNDFNSSHRGHFRRSNLTGSLASSSSSSEKLLSGIASKRMNVPKPLATNNVQKKQVRSDFVVPERLREVHPARKSKSTTQVLKLQLEEGPVIKPSREELTRKYSFKPKPRAKKRKGSKKSKKSAIPDLLLIKNYDIPKLEEKEKEEKPQIVNTEVIKEQSRPVSIKSERTEPEQHIEVMTVEITKTEEKESFEVTESDNDEEGEDQGYDVIPYEDPREELEDSFNYFQVSV